MQRCVRCKTEFILCPRSPRSPVPTATLYTPQLLARLSPTRSTAPLPRRLSSLLYLRSATRTHSLRGHLVVLSPCPSCRRRNIFTLSSAILSSSSSSFFASYSQSASFGFDGLGGGISDSSTVAACTCFPANQRPLSAPTHRAAASSSPNCR